MSIEKTNNSASILILDDEADIRAVLSETLAYEGYEVREVDTGRAALELMQFLAVDVLVTDIIMPNQVGTDVILEAKKLYPEVRIIAISGGGRIHDKRFLEIASKAGADMVLSKPIDTDDFVNCVGEVLSKNI